MQKSHVDIIMYLSCLSENKKIVIIKNNIAIRIAGKVSRYIDTSMNRATPNPAFALIGYACKIFFNKIVTVTYSTHRHSSRLSGIGNIIPDDIAKKPHR